MKRALIVLVLMAPLAVVAGEAEWKAYEQCREERGLHGGQQMHLDESVCDHILPLKDQVSLLRGHIALLMVRIELLADKQNRDMDWVAEGLDRVLQEARR